MIKKVLLPNLGEGIEKAMVAFWHFKAGDLVKKEEDLVELVTDKATFNVTASCEGILKEILVDEGQDAKVGEVLGIIESKK